MILVIVWEFR